MTKNVFSLSDMFKMKATLEVTIQRYESMLSKIQRRKVEAIEIVRFVYEEGLQRNEPTLAELGKGGGYESEEFRKLVLSTMRRIIRTCQEGVKQIQDTPLQGAAN